MAEVLRGVSLLVATLAMGLLAGVFYTFAVSVMPGLARSDDRTFVAAMQQINVAIQNPWFSLTFLGTPVLILVAGRCTWGPVGGACWSGWWRRWCCTW